MQVSSHHLLYSVNLKNGQIPLSKTDTWPENVSLMECKICMRYKTSHPESWRQCIQPDKAMIYLHALHHSCACRKFGRGVSKIQLGTSLTCNSLLLLLLLLLLLFCVDFLILLRLSRELISWDIGITSFKRPDLYLLGMKAVSKDWRQNARVHIKWCSDCDWHTYNTNFRE